MSQVRTTYQQTVAGKQRVQAVTSGNVLRSTFIRNPSQRLNLAQRVGFVRGEAVKRIRNPKTELKAGTKLFTQTSSGTLLSSLTTKGETVPIPTLPV